MLVDVVSTVREMKMVLYGRLLNGTELEKIADLSLFLAASFLFDVSRSALAAICFKFLF